MAELSFIFRRITENASEESSNELSYNEEFYEYQDLLTQESGINNQDFSYFSNNMQYSYVSDQSNNVYYNLINKLNANIRFIKP